MAVKIFLIAGARPNFMKIAPMVRALKDRGQRAEDRAYSVNDLSWKIIHTGRHYDYAMSQTFFGVYPDFPTRIY